MRHGRTIGTLSAKIKRYLLTQSWFPGLGAGRGLRTIAVVITPQNARPTNAAC
jgi:hypothetical protein